MTLKTRRIIYLLLIVLFIIITPLIIVYGIGYAFDWQKKAFVKTGSFYLKTAPSGAQIFINDNSKGKTNKYIKRLLPKTYKITIKKDGFHPWEKNLKIEQQIVTEARNILLISEQPKYETIKDNLEANFSLSLFLAKEDEKKKIEQASSTATTTLKTDSYFLSGDYIFYLNPKDYMIYRSNLDGTGVQQFALSPLPPDSYKISVSQNQKYISVLGIENHELYLFTPENRIFEKVSNDVNGAKFSFDSKKVLYHTASEIWVIYLEKIQIQPYKKAGEKELITRFADKILSAIWYPEDNEHIIFIVGGTIKITEVDGRDRRNTVDFLKLKAFRDDPDFQQMYYDLGKELFYFINDNKLYSAPVKTNQSIVNTKDWVVFGK